MSTFLAVIPARGGSKGIPHKNIKELNGVPLIAYTIKAALQSLSESYIQRLIVSTDDGEIAEVARKFGAEVPFMRPNELANDSAKSVDVILHALKWCESMGEEYDAVLTLQPTSPLRTAEDINHSVEMFSNSKQDSLIAVSENRKANGYNFYRMGENGVGIPLKKEHNIGVRRQDMPPMFVRNGAMYISSVSLLKNRHLIIGDDPLLYVMPAERSVDIDSLDDFEFLNWKMSMGR